MRKLMSSKETAKTFGISLPVLYRLCHSGQIPHIKVGNEFRFVPETVQEWLAAASREGRQL